ncbi:MAG: c-type cytochrome biogenesis protein CcmI [Rhodobiaceae bacterium]|nr:c-type cytochrome biogenesis protein CcmI [Rhodobiaceae bacterium]MCC0019140.1 c-type cytochrome biogenesis protein CcmI [Rhodobiaceae bacterium]MCC0051066.1 c-type cytochrome biogenesis protein CcmI [Rhodobiaceae bacterium]MCC0060087.1 c-type cytochrome biogenesis protein CcmI [Rhodobiaceae bacterium]
MLLWILFAAMAAFAVLIVAAPLARPGGKAARTDSADLEVYKAQLRELERDVDRGVIDTREAEAARIEISRRLLAEEERAGKVVEAAAGGSHKGLLYAVVTAIPLFAVGVYILLGSPQLPGQPMAQRMEEATEGQDIQLLVARVEKHLADNAEDGRGWEVLAPVYRRIGRFDDSARAYANTIRLLGETAERHADYGEMLVAAADGVVKDDARAAFERAIALDPQAIKPRFFLAMAIEQDGDDDRAIAAWNDLLASPQDPGGGWRDRVRERIAALGGKTAPGPTQEQMAAAQEMSAGDRQAMIESMVAGLAERLEQGEGGIDDWLRLIRAYGVLGRHGDAETAAQTASSRFAGDDAALGRIDEARRQAVNGS